MDPQIAAIARACSNVGGQAEMARLLGITPGAVNQWCKGLREIPAERCPMVERLTAGAVTCEELRPDVEWSVLRSRAASEQSSGQAEPEQAAGAEMS